MISRQQIKYIAALQQKKYRNEYKAYIIEGIKMVSEAILQVPDQIEYICYTSKNASLPDISGIAASRLLEVSEKDFEKITSLQTPQGILAVLKQPNIQLLSDKIKLDFTLVLDSIRDPGNLGTIIRLCDWFGIHQLVCSNDTVDCFNPKVVQSTMGAILRVEIKYTDLLIWLSDIKKQNNVVIFGTTMDGQNLYETELKKPSVLIMGNESNGISDEIIELVDKRICIPNQSRYPEKTESLNVSIATAIVCAEFNRLVK